MAEVSRKPELGILRAQLTGKLVRMNTGPDRSWNDIRVGIVERITTYGDHFGRSGEGGDKLIVFLRNQHGQADGPHWLYGDSIEIAGR